MDADKMARLDRRLLLVRAVEPAEVHICVRRTHLQHSLAAGLEAIIERQRPDTVGVVGILAGTPEGAAGLAGLAARIARVAETEIMGSADIGGLVRDAIAGFVPLRIGAEVF